MATKFEIILEAVVSPGVVSPKEMDTIMLMMSQVQIASTHDVSSAARPEASACTSSAGPSQTRSILGARCGYQMTNGKNCTSLVIPDTVIAGRCSTHSASGFAARMIEDQAQAVADQDREDELAEEEAGRAELAAYHAFVAGNNASASPSPESPPLCGAPLRTGLFKGAPCTLPAKAIYGGHCHHHR